MARRPFFREMVTIQSCLNQGYYCNESGSYIYYSDKTKSLFSRLVSFVASCSFSKAKSAKFICKNWFLNSTELQAQFENQNGIVKSEKTFRSQVSNTSALLYGLFPMFSSDIFIYESQEDLKSLSIVLNSLDLVTSTPEQLFISEVCDYIDFRSCTKEFLLEECSSEIDLLRCLTKSAVFLKLDTIDPDKFAFLLNVVSGKMTHLRSRSINVEKAKLLNELCLIGDDSVLFESSQATVSGGRNGLDIDLENSAEVKPSEVKINPYTLELTDSMLFVLKKRLQSTQPWDTVESSTMKSAESVQKLLRLFSLKGFEDMLSKVNKVDLESCLEEYSNE